MMDLSVVIPIKDERENLEPLHDRPAELPFLRVVEVPGVAVGGRVLEADGLTGRQLPGHRVHLFVGQRQSRQPGDMKDLFAVEHGLDSRKGPQVALTGRRRWRNVSISCGPSMSRIPSSRSDIQAPTVSATWASLGMCRLSGSVIGFS